MNNNDMLFDILREIQRDVKDIREEQIAQGFDIKENKDDLKDHMKRTELLENRVEILEEQKIAHRYLWKYVTGFSVLLGIAYTIFRFRTELF